MANDKIGVIEAAYDLDAATPVWLAQLGLAMKRAAGFRRAMALVVDLRPGGTIVSETWEPDLAGMPIDLKELHRHMPLPLARSLYGVGLMAGAVTDRMAESGTGQDTIVPQMLGVLGASDVLGVPGVDPDGRGAVIAALIEQGRGVSEQEALAWSRVAAHVAAGFRLRRELGGAEPVERAEAVLTTDGKLEHAEGDEAKGAREVLHEAVRNVDRARTKRADESEGLELWEGLVAGRWSLVDHFAGGERRYYVAVKNPPIAQYLRGLTDRERIAIGYAAAGSSHKVAAYALGTDPASFSRLVNRALAKLGVPSRTALVELVARLGIEPDEPPADR